MSKITDDPILIVDDMPHNLKVLSQALTETGLVVAIATSGEIALEIVAYKPPSLILLDVMMPEMDGFETCKQLKSNPQTREIPVIFMTALTDPLDKVTGLSLGAVDYITKPFQIEEVLARVRTHLELRKLTQNLAQQVAERTAELTHSLQRLQQTQLQLIQSEKMSTLGQLVAGVAHEINNPLCSMAGYVDLSREAVKILLEELQFYRKKCWESGIKIESNPPPELEDILTNLPHMFQRMKLCTDRMINVSNSLRIFSRSDSDRQVIANLHDGIESTLIILNHRFKANQNRPEIQVITEYGEIPPIHCYPGQLNQVFMNLIANSIDALEESYNSSNKPNKKDSLPTICIQTKVRENHLIAIHIKDNGIGMSESVQQRAFDYLFTTKPMGKGTGLGLAISRQIVEEKHGGKLRCSSQLNQGTEFIVEIPIG